MDRVLVVGYPYWAGVAADLLRAAGLDAAVWRAGIGDLPAAIRWCPPLRWLAFLLDRDFRAARVIHHVGTVSSRKLLWAARRMGKRVVLHWVGTDVLVLAKAVAQGNREPLEFYQAIADFHFADSPEIAAELAELGLHAEVFRLLPTSVEAREVPMPREPAVLTYWSSAHREFYRGDIVDALADEFKDVKFFVAGSDGAGQPRHPNMQYLGWLPSLEAVYGKTSVLIRMPEHDSLSAMVLEMLARGRWVIYSKPFPHTETATNLEEARAALARCLARQGPNREGQEYVRQNFSPSHEAQRIAPIYSRILHEGDREGCVRQ